MCVRGYVRACVCVVVSVLVCIINIKRFNFVLLLHSNRFDKVTLDYGQVAEVTFWEFRFKKKIGPYTINQFKVGYIAK